MSQIVFFIQLDVFITTVSMDRGFEKKQEE